ncbi:MAG: patatin-like phospholipase family protein [Peptostreptococcaceae bacterium]
MRGLVLEGGGTKGAYQIGAVKALRELGIEFQGVTGTSIGALNGAFIIQNDIEIMEDIWKNHDYTSFMNMDEDTYERYKNLDFTAKNINIVLELMNKARKNEGIDISPLKKILEDNINEEAIRNSNKDFGIVTVHWDKKFKPHQLYIEDIPKGRLVDYLIASASLPIFNLEKMDDKLFLDGMFSDNIPVKLLVDKGYTDIVIIRLMDDFLGKMSINKFNDSEVNLKIIVPSEPLGGSLNKDKDIVEKNILIGYLDTMKAFERYEGVKYYFNLDYKYDENYCFDKFYNLKLETIESLCNTLNIKRDVSRRTLLENIIPKLGEVLNLPKEFSYKDLFYAVYEQKLQENEINRVSLYDFNKLIEIVHKNYKNKRDSEEINENKDVKYSIPIIKSKLPKILTNQIIADFKNQG